MEDFNNGAKTIGSGPYRFIRGIPADRVELIANSDWRQGKPAYYDRVVLKFISNGAGWIAVLLSGVVDVTERILPSDISTPRGGRISRCFPSPPPACAIW